MPTTPTTRTTPATSAYDTAWSAAVSTPPWRSRNLSSMSSRVMRRARSGCVTPMLRSRGRSELTVDAAHEDVDREDRRRGDDEVRERTRAAVLLRLQPLGLDQAEHAEEEEPGTDRRH